MDGLNKSDLIRLEGMIKAVDELSKKVGASKSQTGKESAIIVELQRAFNSLHNAADTLEILLAVKKFREEEQS